MNTDKEIAKLKKEVTQLKRELAELKEFFEIKRAFGSREKVLTITCSHIFLESSDAPHELGGMFSCDGNGPVMQLWGKDMLSRVTLEVEEDVGRFTLYDAEREPAVEAGVSVESATGIVIVSHQGNPRVVMKGEEEGGFVGVVHDDALVRAAMQSRQDQGEIAVINPDMQRAVSITTDKETSGGYVTINHANGKIAIGLGSDGNEGAAVFLDAKGKVVGLVPEPSGEEDSE